MAAAGTREPVSSSSSTAVRVLIVLAGLGLLVGVVGLAVSLLVSPRGESADRAEIVSRANDFAVTYNTYEVTAKDDYQERMRDLLTPAYYREFAEVTDAVFAALESDDQSSGNARVLSVAIDSIDEESAVALVAVNAAITNDSEDAAIQRRFRWTVTFAKEGDDWLVSQFESVVPSDAQAGQVEPEAGGDPLDPGAETPDEPEEGQE